MNQLKTNRIAIIIFILKDMLKQLQFFEETFLVANISLEVILKMLFLFVSNANIQISEIEKLS